MDKNNNAVEEILSTARDINLLAKVSCVKTFLILAIEINALEIVKILCTRCPELMTTPHANGRMPIEIASEPFQGDNQSSYEIFEYLATQRPECLTKPTSNNATLLHISVKGLPHGGQGMEKFEKILFLHQEMLSPEAYKALLNTLDKDGNSVLNKILGYPVTQGPPHYLITFLLESGAALTPAEVSTAVKTNNHDAQKQMVQYASKNGTLAALLSQGISVDVTTQILHPRSYKYFPFYTALYSAIIKWDIVAIKVLLENGANPDFSCGNDFSGPNGIQKTPLEYALAHQMTEILQALLPYSKLPPQRIWDIAFNYQRQGDQYNPILVETLLAQPHCDKTEALRQAQQYDPTYIVKIAPPEDASITLAPPVAPILSSGGLQHADTAPSEGMVATPSATLKPE